MMYVSILYSKMWHNLKEDIMLWVWNNTSGDVDVSQTQKSDSSIQDKLSEIYDFDISLYSWVKFIFMSGKNITIQSVWITKISAYLLEKFDKNTFQPSELLPTYNFLVKNYHTKLSQSDFNTVTQVLYEFVEGWWSVELIKK